MPVDPARAKSLFLEASDLPSTADRSAFLDRECGGDPELRARVEALLAVQDRAGPVPNVDATVAFEPRPAETLAGTQIAASENPSQSDPTAATGILDQGATLDGPASVALDTRTRGFVPGQVLAGRYTLRDVLGEGGLGTVYLAEQTEPVKRQVALKLIKLGMDSRAVLARFDAERQALALMDHPNIARVYDGGTTDTGQPFFVMELVNGLPITDYCDRKRLPVKARLELFVAVCQAVQHAHQKGIIHRDLKPSNVMVTEVDGRPTPKVIDFGVAKATEFDLTDQSLGDTGAIVGTPTYMSPEQADPSTMDIDTRTDVYALGVILYELLAGSPPIDARQFQRGAILEMLRMVREVDPPRPSTKLSTAEALPNVAANRSIEPARLARLLQGELDWVVMKALEKDRERRYETANAFAHDIQRYLADEVVEARPPSRGYRLKKFIKRNKIQVIAASLVFFALVAGVSGTTFGMIRAEQRRQEAERNLAFARKGNEILGSVFAGLDPRKIAESGRPLQDVLRENLVTAVKQLEGSAIGDPLEVAEMRTTLGVSLYGLGEYDLAVEVWEKVRATRKAKLGPDHPHTLTSMGHLAGSYRAAGKLDKALPLYEETLALLKAKLGPDHPDTLNSMNNLALGYGDAGKLDKALPLLEETMALMKAKLGPDDPNTLKSMNNLALGYQNAGKLDKALPLLEETMALMKAKLGPDDPNTLISAINLASGYERAGKLDKALPLYEETLALMKAKLGPDHPYTLACMHNLASGYEAAGKLDKALPLYKETLALRKAKLGPDHPDTLACMNTLAAGYWAMKRFDRSVPLFEEVLTLKEKKLGRDHPNTLSTVGNLGVNYKDAGRLTEAIPLLEEAYQAAKKNPTLRWVGGPLLDAYAKAGENAKLADLIQEQSTEARKTVAADSPMLAELLAPIGLSLLQQKKWTEAEPILHECLTIREKTQPDGWRTFNTQSLLGGTLLGQKKYDKGEPLLLSGYEGMKSREKAIPPISATCLPEALDRLIELSTATNKPDDVKKWQAERAKYAEAAPPPGEKE